MLEHAGSKEDYTRNVLQEIDGGRIRVKDRAKSRWLHDQAELGILWRIKQNRWDRYPSYREWGAWWWIGYRKLLPQLERMRCTMVDRKVWGIGLRHLQCWRSMLRKLAMTIIIATTFSKDKIAGGMLYLYIVWTTTGTRCGITQTE